MILITPWINVTQDINCTNLLLKLIPAQDRDKEDGFDKSTL